jgi:hypothetical protein
MLCHEDGNPFRLHYHVEHLQNRILPLFEHMQNIELLLIWLSACAHTLGHLLVELRTAVQGVEARYVIIHY